MNPFPSTASPLEIVWLIDALLGLGMAVFMVDFWIDKRSTLRDARHHEARRTALNAHLFRKTYYLCCHIWFITVGVMLALLRNTAQHSEGLRHWTSIALVLMLLFTAIGMQIDMIQAYVRYRRIENDWD